MSTLSKFRRQSSRSRASILLNTRPRPPSNCRQGGRRALFCGQEISIRIGDSGQLDPNMKVGSIYIRLANNPENLTKSHASLVPSFMTSQFTDHASGVHTGQSSDFTPPAFNDLFAMTIENVSSNRSFLTNKLTATATLQNTPDTRKKCVKTSLRRSYLRSKTAQARRTCGKRAGPPARAPRAGSGGARNCESKRK